jgi:hypothetical protein
MMQFLVKSKGYRQLYSDFERARKDYEKLKAKFLRDKTPLKIELFKVEENGDLRLLESVLITENSNLLND